MSKPNPNPNSLPKPIPIKPQPIILPLPNPLEPPGLSLNLYNTDVRNNRPLNNTKKIINSFASPDNTFNETKMCRSMFDTPNIDNMCVSRSSRDSAPFYNSPYDLSQMYAPWNAYLIPPPTQAARCLMAARRPLTLPYGKNPDTHHIGISGIPKL